MAAISVAVWFTGSPSSLPSSLMMSVSPTSFSLLHPELSTTGTVSRIAVQQHRLLVRSDDNCVSLHVLFLLHQFTHSSSSRS
nr:MAG TPA: hypothetical protein [Caudoviricetes sp.]